MRRDEDGATAPEARVILFGWPDRPDLLARAAYPHLPTDEALKRLETEGRSAS